MSTRVKRDMPTLRALKQEGHDIIDDLVKKGWSKSTVYRMLADRLQVQEQSAHFYNIYTVRDARTAVEVLKALRAELIAERNRKRRERAQKAKEEPEPKVVMTVHAKPSFIKRLLKALGI